MSLPEGFVAPTSFGDTSNGLVKKPTVGALGTQTAQFCELEIYDERASQVGNKEMYRTEEICLISNDKFCTVPIRVKDLSPKQKAELKPLYEAFHDRKEVYGTLLSEWHVIGDSDRSTLLFEDLKTVEQVAAIGDHELHRLGKNRVAIREKARQHLRAKEESGQTNVVELMAENKKLMERMSAMEADIAKHQKIAAEEKKTETKGKKNGNSK